VQHEAAAAVSGETRRQQAAEGRKITARAGAIDSGRLFYCVFNQPMRTASATQ
jgi:hypothetical protein